MQLKPAEHLCVVVGGLSHQKDRLRDRVRHLSHITVDPITSLLNALLDAAVWVSVYVIKHNFYKIDLQQTYCLNL